MSGDEFDKLRVSGDEFDKLRVSGDEFDKLRVSGDEFDKLRASGDEFDKLRVSGDEFGKLRVSGDEDVAVSMTTSTGPYATDQKARISGVLSPWVKGFRMRRAARQVNELARRRGEIRVLDFGCGFGEFAATLDPSCHYLGVDRNAGVLEAARRARPEMEFLLGDSAAAVAATPQNPAPPIFDAIVVLALVEHLARPLPLLADLAALLAPGGIMVISTPHPCGAALHAAGARWGLLSASAAAEHHTFFSGADLAAAARHCGLETIGYERFLAGLNQLAVWSNGNGGRQ